MSDGGNKKNKWMPQEAQIALLASTGPLHEAYLERLRYMAAHNMPLMSDEKMVPGKAMNDVLWRPDANLPKNASVTAEAAATAPIDETENEISSIEQDGYTEKILSHGNYFVRRLFVANKPFWAGSAYSPKGPWKPFFCDQTVYDTLFQPEAVHA